MTSDKDTNNWLAERPPTRREVLAAIAIAATGLVALLAVIPYAAMPLAQLNAFFPSLDAIVFVSDLTTAVLLFAQFSISRSRALLVLANGYLFTALIVIPHALTFSGAFTPNGLLGAGPQTGSWLFIFWHIGFALALLAYAILRVQTSTKASAEPAAWTAIVWSVAINVALVGGLTWLSTAGENLLPPIIVENRIDPFVVYPISLAILISAIAIAVLLIRFRSVLDLWLMVVALVSIGELALSGLVPTARFSTGFYAGRGFALVTSAIVLIVLLAETTRLYGRMARSNAILQREHDNKLMSFEAIVASIGHEIKQPLSAIELNGSSAALILKRERPNLEEARSIVEDMMHAGRRVDETLESFRTLFGTSKQEPQVLNLNDIILDALHSSNSELKGLGVTARVKLKAQLPNISGHRNQLYQVIYNLVHNAIEATANRTTDHDGLVEVRTDYQDNSIVVEVSDNGSGIDPVKMPKIFDAFVTTKRNGTGLGLAICRMIVEGHNGDLSFTSANQRGSVFRVVLPVGSNPIAE